MLFCSVSHKGKELDDFVNIPFNPIMGGGVGDGGNGRCNRNQACHNDCDMFDGFKKTIHKCLAILCVNKVIM